MKKTLAFLLELGLELLVVLACTASSAAPAAHPARTDLQFVEFYSPM